MPLFLISNFLYAPRIFVVEITSVRLPASHIVNKICYKIISGPEH